MALGQVSPRVLQFSPVSFHSTGAPLKWKSGKTLSSSQVWTISLQGCGASVASAAGPFSKKKRKVREM